jgi:hypothetical protein
MLAKTSEDLHARSQELVDARIKQHQLAADKERLTEQNRLLQVR